MHKNNFIVSIKSNGSVLREFNDKVYIKFGSIYSIYLKNNESRKALADIYIDGKCVMKGLIISANSYVDLERFYEKNNDKGHKFKFIEKTERVSAVRGDFPEDGIVLVKWRFEKVKYTDLTYTNAALVYRSYMKGFGDVTLGTGLSNDVTLTSNMPTFSTSKGITANGEYSNQKFISGYIGELEEIEHTISLELIGKNDNDEKIEKTIEVKKSNICPTCNLKNKSINKYCRECGTYLL